MGGTTLQERGLLSPHTNTQTHSPSDHSHLNYQHNSDYPCILCTELQWSSPGNYPHVACVIWILCVGVQVHQSQRKGAERVLPTATETIISSPKSTSALALRIFTLLPSIAAYCSHVRGPSSPFSICCCGTRYRTAIKAASGQQATCQLETQGLERANLDAAKMAAWYLISVLKG